MAHKFVATACERAIQLTPLEYRLFHLDGLLLQAMTREYLILLDSDALSIGAFANGDLAMALRDQLNNAVKAAMKARDQKRLSCLRLVQAALKDRDIAARTEESRDPISDDDILGLLAKLIKQREDSIALYEKGGRPELAAAEQDEIAVIREFMPKQMDEAEAKAAIAGVIAELGAASMKDMGKVMAALKERFSGKMDFSKASAAVKELLSAPK
jgi:hypothetical protein